jgi:hypothetical protein
MHCSYVLHSVPTYGILFLHTVFFIIYLQYLLLLIQSDSIFHQAAISITSVVQQNPRHKAELLCFGDYCFN